MKLWEDYGMAIPYGKYSKNPYSKILNFEKENTKNSVREVTNFAKGGN